MKPETTEQLLARRRVLGPAYRLFYEEPLRPVKGEGVWLWDDQGRRYLDAYNNVPVVGHANPHVTQALVAQAQVLNTHTRYLHPGVLNYAERLLVHFPAQLDTAMLTCTGSEANDLALRIARAATGGQGIVVSDHAYHGVTQALAETSPSLAPIGAHVRTVPAPMLQGDETLAQAQQRFGRDVAAAFADLQSHGVRPAALMVDTIFASDGIVTLHPGAFDAAIAATHAAGALFIADEVQAGFGRIGNAWWGFQLAKALPDLVTMGKPMGNGHPMGGVVLSAALAKDFASKGRYFNTFGGNPVSAAVGLAVLEQLEQGILAQAHEVGELLGEALRSRMPAVGCSAVRGNGLYWGVELQAGATCSAPARATHAANALRRNGVLVGNCGIAGQTLKIRPPLVINAADVLLLVDTLEQVLGEV